MNKEKLMQRAIDLAKKGSGFVSPNPLVGAVLWKKGKIISEGYHRAFGTPHAEIQAIRKAASPKGATLVVNLEPCIHHGKTPPCAPRIVKAGIKKVIIGTPDPNPLVSGRGIKFLRKSGVKVEVGVLKEKCVFLNRGFFSAHIRKRPWVMLKLGISLDGKIATKTHNSKWLTNEKARVFVHELRKQSDIVLAGRKTFQKDKPSLLPYLIKSKRKHPLGYPVRCLLTQKTKISDCLKIVDNSHRTIIAVRDKSHKKRFKNLPENISVLYFKNLNNLLKQFCKNGYNTIMLEGGGEVAGSFFDEGLVDEVYFIYAPVVVGGKNAINSVSGRGVNKVSEAKRFENFEVFPIDDNIIFHGVDDLCFQA